MEVVDFSAIEKRIKIVRDIFLEGMMLRNKLFDENNESQYVEVEHLKFLVGALFHLIFDVEFERTCYNEAHAAMSLEERNEADKHLRECIGHTVEVIESIEDMRQYGGFECEGLEIFEHDCYVVLKDLKREYQKLLKKIAVE